MIPPSRDNGAEKMVEVRLGDVPYKLRVTVADEIIRRGGLTGSEATDMLIAAYVPNGGKLAVPAWKVPIVASGKRPPGETPPVWRY